MLGLLGAVRPRWPHLALGRSRGAGLEMLGTSCRESSDARTTTTGRRHGAGSPSTWDSADVIAGCRTSGRDVRGADRFLIHDRVGRMVRWPGNRPTWSARRRRVAEKT